MKYFLNHRPIDIREFPEYRIDLIMDSGIMPNDIFTNPRAILGDKDTESKDILSILKDVQRIPDATVTIYRGAPSSGVLNTGDWVTLSKMYAEKYAAGGDYCDRPDAKVYRYTVKAKDLSFDGDSIYEFGYWGPQILGIAI